MTIFDWISPLLGFIETANGMKTITVDDVGTIDLLKRNGVRVGAGTFYRNGVYVITVDDLEKARRILNMAGRWA